VLFRSIEIENRDDCIKARFAGFGEELPEAKYCDQTKDKDQDHTESTDD
jgi:hypothetical protein